jgi:hypothetical protein
VLADNSSTGECPFISSCERGVQSANSSGQYNSSVVQEAQQFVANCSAQFASQSNGNSRLQIVLNLFVSLSQECRLLLKQIQVSGASIACLVADVVSIGNCVSLFKAKFKGQSYGEIKMANLMHLTIWRFAILAY